MRKNIEKIALINPIRPLWSKNPSIYKMFESNKQYIKPWYSLPLGLLTIAGATPEKIDISVIDEDFENIDYSKEYDIVGISLMTQQAYRAYQIADEFRKRNVPVVMGGIHPTVLPNEALEHCDTVIIGEGETLWNQYLRDFKNGCQKKMYKSDSNTYINLNDSPVPRYDLVKPDYFTKNEDFFNLVPIQATRGCPHECSFCLVTKIYGHKIRKKSIEQIIKELELIKKCHNAPTIGFSDDNLFVDKKYTKELLRALIPLRIKWFGQADIRLADDEDLLKLAYLSGCITLLIGFESLNVKNLLNVNYNQWKMKQVKKYTASVNKIQKNGIVVYAAFIIGFDHDNTSTFKEIRDFSISNFCPGQFTFLTPIPGSEIYEKYKNDGQLYSNEFWDQSNFFDIVIKHNSMSYKEMEEGLIWLYEEVFNKEKYMERFVYMKNVYKTLPPRWQYKS